MRAEGKRLLLVGAVLALSGLSLLLRMPCLGQSVVGAVVSGCGGDLQLMWLHRGLAEGRVPYLQPFLDPQGGQLVTVEYPVLTGMLMWLFSLPGSYPAFVALSGLAMAVAAVGVVLVLYRWCGHRAWLWAAAPALVHYQVYNYDALPALTVVAALGLLLGQDPLRVGRARFLWAAAILGCGGGLKLFPLLFLLPLGLWLAMGRPGPDQSPVRVRIARAFAAGMVGSGVFVALNLPFAIANPQGWALPFSFQASRPIDATTLSVWFVLDAVWPGLGATDLMLVATAATAVAIGVAAWDGWLRGLRRGSFPLLGTSVTVLVAYLVANKVFSPQYIIWLLPLLILAGIRTRVIITCLVVDVFMFATISLIPVARSSGDPGVLMLVSAGSMVAMIARLACVIWAGVGARRSAEPAPPSATVTARFAASRP